MKSYFYLDAQNSQHGPVPPERFAECGVTPTTLVWCMDMSDWQPANSQPELREWFEAHASSAPQQPEQPTGQQTSQQQATYSQQTYGQQNYGGAQQGNYGQQQQYYGAPQQPAYGAQQQNYGGMNNGYLPCPPTYLVWAILSTICCCLPFGIVAIIKANEVSSCYARGQYDDALIASADAKKWCVIALICGLIWSFSYSFLFLPWYL